MVFRRSLLLILALLAVGAAACGGGDRPTQVAAGGEPSPATSTTLEPTSVPSTAAAVTTSVPQVPQATTTTAPVLPGADRAASPVAGLQADQLKAVLEAPVGGSIRSAAGPTVDQVTLPDGTRVWRVRVPGAFAARSARVAVSVGGRRIGEGVQAADLQSITAVTTDGTGLTAGQPVTYQWEGGASVPAGTLTVVR